MPTSAEIFNSMRLDILEYGGKWRGFFYGMGIAYEKAFKDQEAFLTRIYDSVKTMGGEYDDAKLFLLSIAVTLIGGPAASSFADRVSPFRKKAADTLKGLDTKTPTGVEVKPPSKMIEFGFETAQDAILKNWAESIQGKVKWQPPSADKFTPVGKTPTAYLASLLKGAEERTNVMSDTARSWAENANLFTDVAAKTMAENMKKSVFFTGAPDSAMGAEMEALLERKANLSLWIAYAQQRDKDYWVNATVAAGTPWGNKELFLWEPARVFLIKFGVPYNIVSKSVYNGTKVTQVFNFPGFIEWSHSVQALNAMTSGIPSMDKDAYKLAYSAWMAKLAANR